MLMDMTNNGLNLEVKNNGLSSLDSQEVVESIIEESDESKALLPSSGGLSKKSDKPKRKVQWMDRNGDKLAEILEFQPSDASDSEEDDSDSCICRVM